MTALILFLFGSGLLILGALLIWPVAYRAGRISVRYQGQHRLTWTAEIRLLLAPKPQAVTWIPVRPAAQLATVVELPAGATFGQPVRSAA